jgi:putative transposase
MDNKLLISTPEQALMPRQLPSGLIIYTDRGSQYTSLAYCTRINQAQALAGYCHTELLPQSGVFACLEEARLEVAYYLNTYFNLARRHSSLGYRSPY